MGDFYAIIILSIFFSVQPIGMEKYKYNKIRVHYHQEAIPNETILYNFVNKAESMITQKGFPMPNSRQVIYLCKSKPEFKIKSLTIRNIVKGKNFIILKRIYLREFDIEKDEIISSNPTIFNNRQYSGLIAHELMHSHQRKKLGIVKFIFTPKWKKEGTAEYVTDIASQKTEIAMPIYLEGLKYTDTLQCKKRHWKRTNPYWRGRLRTDYLFNYKHISEDEFWKTHYKKDELDEEIRTAIKQGDYIFDNFVLQDTIPND